MKVKANKTVKLISLLLLVSCNVSKKCAELYPPKTDTVRLTKDSIIITHDVRNVQVPVYLPGDYVFIHDTLKVGEDYHKTVSSKYMTAEASVKNNVLNVNCKTDSLLKVIANLQDTVTTIQHYNDALTKINVVREIPKEIPKPYIPKWMIWLTMISVGYWVWKIYAGITGNTLLGLIGKIFKKA